MAKNKVKKFLLGGILLGSVAGGMTNCSADDNDQTTDSDTTKTEITPTKENEDTYGNIALFERTRSKIKFAMTFVENCYEYTYFCGEAWTTGSGLTILYNQEGTSKEVTKKTKPVTLKESDIKNYITVPMDENTLLAACALRYCIGGKNFKKSSFVKQLNAGKTGAELAKTLSGWRQQEGVPKRCYFFAALLAGKMSYADLLDLRTEGCYNLTWKDIFVYDEKGENPIKDKQGFCEWDFSKLKTNLQKAKQPRTTVLTVLGKKGKKTTVKVQCKLTKEVVAPYIWDEVSNNSSGIRMYQDEESDIIDSAKDKENNEKSGNGGAVAWGLIGAAAAAYGAKKYLGSR